MTSESLKSISGGLEIEPELAPRQGSNFTQMSRSRIFPTWALHSEIFNQIWAMISCYNIGIIFPYKNKNIYSQLSSAYFFHWCFGMTQKLSLCYKDFFFKVKNLLMDELRRSNLQIPTIFSSLLLQYPDGALWAHVPTKCLATCVLYETCALAVAPYCTLRLPSTKPIVIEQILTTQSRETYSISI